MDRTGVGKATHPQFVVRLPSDGSARRRCAAGADWRMSFGGFDDAAALARAQALMYRPSRSAQAALYTEDDDSEEPRFDPRNYNGMLPTATYSPSTLGVVKVTSEAQGQRRRSASSIHTDAEAEAEAPQQSPAAVAVPSHGIGGSGSEASVRRKARRQSNGNLDSIIEQEDENRASPPRPSGAASQALRGGGGRGGAVGRGGTSHDASSGASDASAESPWWRAWNLLQAVGVANYADQANGAVGVASVPVGPDGSPSGHAREPAAARAAESLRGLHDVHDSLARDVAAMHDATQEQLAQLRDSHAQLRDSHSQLWQEHNLLWQQHAQLQASHGDLRDAHAHLADEVRRMRLQGSALVSPSRLPPPSECSLSPAVSPMLSPARSSQLRRRARSMSQIQGPPMPLGPQDGAQRAAGGGGDRGDRGDGGDGGDRGGGGDGGDAARAAASDRSRPLEAPGGAARAGPPLCPVRAASATSLEEPSFDGWLKAGGAAPQLHDGGTPHSHAPRPDHTMLASPAHQPSPSWQPRTLPLGGDRTPAHATAGEAVDGGTSVSGRSCGVASGTPKLVLTSATHGHGGSSGSRRRVSPSLAARMSLFSPRGHRPSDSETQPEPRSSREATAVRV